MMTKDFYLYDRIFKSNRNFTTEHVKIPKFFSDFCSKFQVFPDFFESNRNFSFEHVKIVQIQVFSRFF